MGLIHSTATGAGFCQNNLHRICTEFVNFNGKETGLLLLLLLTLVEEMASDSSSPMALIEGARDKK